MSDDGNIETCNNSSICEREHYSDASSCCGPQHILKSTLCSDACKQDNQCWAVVFMVSVTRHQQSDCSYCNAVACSTCKCSEGLASVLIQERPVTKEVVTYVQERRPVAKQVQCRAKLLY